MKKNIFVVVFLFCAALAATAALAQSVSDELEENFLYYGNYEGAIRFLEDFVKSKPDDAEAHLQLGISYMKVGRHMDAVYSFERATMLAPDDAFAHVWLARAKAEMGMTHEAGQLLEKARLLAPDNPRLQVFAAGVLYEMGDPAAAEDIAWTLIDEETGYTTTDGSEVMMLFFATLELDGLDTAVDVMEQAGSLRKSPDPCFELPLSDVYIGRGADFFPAATEALDAAKDECDECGMITFRKGYMADMTGNYAEAEDLYRNTVENACLDKPPTRGGRLAGVLMYYALFNNGYDSSELLDILDTEQDKYGDSPYFYWLRSLLCWYSGAGCAVEEYLKAVPMAPANFEEEPGPYTVLLPDDYEALRDIAREAEKDMPHFEFVCNPDSPLPIGTFFTSEINPGADNLFRYTGPGKKEYFCSFAQYASTGETDLSIIEENPPFMPVPFSESSFFVRRVYPSAGTFENFWYVPQVVVFPKFAQPE